MRKLIAAIALLFSLVYTNGGLQAADTKLPSDSAIATAKANQTALTCFSPNEDQAWGGQGEIIKVDEKGVLILTAGHMTAVADHCDALFPDNSLHIGIVEYTSMKSDYGFILIPDAYWPTHANVAPVKLHSRIFVFSEVKPDLYKWQDTLVGYIYTFNYAVHTGILSVPTAPNFVDYTAANKHLIDSDVYAVPGSSGGGVYDYNGNLVGLVSGGNTEPPYLTFILDITNAMQEDSK
jgi:S1-C subfamily serine protease